ncbi:hypothetical protein EIP91_010241 [Steccherinum ochraceum]|uniref:Uncharacterized protein n=1 Tax=Steccherinum ochraceum TaxID=92696 RepID=A0A4R0RA04_9APHY|nr:hypothetical protein EIP91_010241 [Steccherinum ochraceum]
MASRDSTLAMNNILQTINRHRLHVLFLEYSLLVAAPVDLSPVPFTSLSELHISGRLNSLSFQKAHIVPSLRKLSITTHTLPPDLEDGLHRVFPGLTDLRLKTYPYIEQVLPDGGSPLLRFVHSYCRLAKPLKDVLDGIAASWWSIPADLNITPPPPIQDTGTRDDSPSTALPSLRHLTISFAPLYFDGGRGNVLLLYREGVQHCQHIAMQRSPSSPLVPFEASDVITVRFDDRKLVIMPAPGIRSGEDAETDMAEAFTRAKEEWAKRCTV